MPRTIELPSRGITVEFSDRATDEQIQDFLDREYPRSGQDVAYELGQDPKFHRSTDFTLEDYEMYRDYMSTSAQPGAWESAYIYLSSTVKGAAKEAVSNMGNPNPIDALKVLGTSFAAGTGDLVDLAARGFEFQSAEDTYQKHLEENKASDSESERKKYLGLLAKDHRDFKRQMDYQGFRQKIIDASPAPYLTEANTLWADPSVVITGGTSAIGKTGAKLATKAGSKLGTGVRMVGQTADKLGMLPERIAGAVAGEGAEDFVRGATTVGAGAGLAGIGAGPGVYAFGALKGGGRTLNVAGDMIEATAEAAQRGGRRGVLDQASELAETAAGQKLLSGLSRIETPLAYGVEAGKGALYGGAIGGGLGFVAEGKDGFFHGLAMGSMMGAPAGVLGRGIADVTGFRYASMSRDDAVKYLSSRPDAQFAVKALDRMSAEDAALIGDAVELGRQHGVRVEFHDDSQRPVGLDPSISHTEYKGVEVGPDGVYINTDRIDGSTVAHEVFHSIGYHMGREQFIESIKGVLIGQRDPVSGNLIREGDVPIETLKQFGRAYATQFSKMANKARREGKSREADALNQRASKFLNEIEAGDYSKVIDEFGAYYFDAFVRGEEPKILIGGEKDLVKNTLSWAKKKMAANFQRDIARQGMDFSQGVGEAFIRGDKRQFALPAFDKLIKRMIKEGSVDTTHRVPVTGIPTKEAYKLAQMHGAAHLFELDASGQPIGAKTKGDLDAEFEADFDKVLEQLERLPSTVRRSRITEDAKGRKKLIAESITPEEAVILQDSIRHLNPYQRQMLMDLANGMTGDGGKQTYRVSYWKASGASRSKRKPYDQFEVSEREVLPFSLEMNKTGGLYFRFVDMDAVRGNLRKATRLSEYKNLYPNFKELEADFLRYLENLDSETPADSAAFLGGGETGVAKRNLFYEGLGIVPRKDARLKNLARDGYTPKRGRNYAFKSFRIERVGNMTPTGERIAFSDSRAYERGMENLMPDDGTVRAEPDQTFKLGNEGVARFMPDDSSYLDAASRGDTATARFMPDIPDLRPRGAAERRVYEDAASFKAKGKQPRNPELAVAAYRLFKGKISHEQFADIVDVLLPWDVIGGPPDVPSAGKIKKYLVSSKYDKRRKFNLSKRNIDGQTVEVRIDIPAWEKSAPLGDPTYVVTLHEPVPDTATKVGKPITYDGIAVVDNPTFVVRAISKQGGPIMIAMGKGKTPLATVKGSYKKLKPKELKALLPQLSDSSVWTEAGFNPLRSSDFTDVRTKQSVVGGDTAVMVGNRVFVKNAKLAPKPTGITGKRSNDMSPKSPDVADFRFMPDIGPAPKRADDGWVFPNGKFLGLGGLDHEGAFNSWANKKRNNSYANQVLGLRNDRVIKEDGHPDEPVRRKDILKAGIVRVVREGDGVHRKIHAQGNMNRTQKAALERMAINSERSLSHDPSLEQHGEGLFYGRSSKLIYETPKKLRFNKERESMRQEMVDAGLIRFQPDIGGQDSLGMFSAAERATVDLKQERGSASQMLAMIKKAGVKDEEIAELGLDKFLEGNRKVSKDEIVDYLVENQITVEETVLRGLHDFAAEDVGIGDISQRARVMIDNYRDQRHSVEYMREDVDYMKDDLRDYELEGVLKYIDYVEKNGHPEKKVYSPTKFEGYVEPGADEGSYRELLLRLPESKYIGVADYTGGHYGEYTNVLAHVRFNDRTSEYGKTLFLEEMQSDWHQEGRKKGYVISETEKARLKLQLEKLKDESAALFFSHKKERNNLVDEMGWEEAQASGHGPTGWRRRHVREKIEMERRIDEAQAAYQKAFVSNRIPDAPFKTSWHELSMKRMISYAAKNGYDAIAWTKGETQANRYSLSKQVDEIHHGYKTMVDGAVVNQVTAIKGPIMGDHSPTGGGQTLLNVFIKEDGTVARGEVATNDVTGKHISDIVGKEIAEKIMRGDSTGPAPFGGKKLSGEDLKVGGEGMEGFYDRMLPKMKTWKKLGLKVGPGYVKAGRQYHTVPQVAGGDGVYFLEGRGPDGLVRLPGTYDTPAAAMDAAGRIGTDGIPAHIVKLTPEVKAKVLDTGIARFMPDASVPGAEKNSIGWSMILSKAGKWRVYDPSGGLAGIASSKAVAERIFRTKHKRELRRSSLAK